MSLRDLGPGSANPRSTKWQRWWRTASTTRQLRLIGPSAMFDTIREARVHRCTAEVKVRLTWMTHWPTADLVRQIEQACLVGNLRARFGRNETPRRGRWDRSLLVTGALTEEAARPD